MMFRAVFYCIGVSKVLYLCYLLFVNDGFFPDLRISKGHGGNSQHQRFLPLSLSETTHFHNLVYYMGCWKQACVPWIFWVDKPCKLWTMAMVPPYEAKALRSKRIWSSRRLVDSPRNPWLSRKRMIQKWWLFMVFPLFFAVQPRVSLKRGCTNQYILHQDAGNDDQSSTSNVDMTMGVDGVLACLEHGWLEGQTINPQKGSNMEAFMGFVVCLGGPI